MVKNKRGMSLISLGLMTILIIVLTVSIAMLLFTAIKNNINNIEKAPTYIDGVMGI